MNSNRDSSDAAFAQLAIIVMAIVLAYIAIWLGIVAFLVLQAVNHYRREKMRDLARRDFDRRLIDANMHFTPDTLLRSAFPDLQFDDDRIAGGIVFHNEDAYIPGIR